MPTVPTYTRQVRDSAGPNIRQSTNVNQSAFGIGGFQGLNSAIDQIAKIKNDADQIEVTSAFTERSKRIETIKTDPENGFLSKQGRNAIESYDSTIQSIKDADEEIVQKFNLTGNKLEMYNRLRDRDDLQNQSQLNRHLTGERRRLDDDTQKAFIQTETDSAIKNFQDPSAVNYKLENIEGSIIAYGKRNGLSDEEVNFQRANIRSGIRSGVVSQYLNSGDDRGAKAYFEQHKDAFTAKDNEKLQKDLELGSLRGESQRESDKIFAESSTLGQAIEKVRKIEDPKLRDETMQRVRQNFQMKEAVDQETRENRSSKIATLLESNSGDLDRIPPAEWNQMTAAERTSWRNYSKSIQKGNIETDAEVYYALITEAQSDKESFAKKDLYQYKGSLGMTEFKELAKMQTQIRGNAESAESKATIQSIYSNKQLVEKQFESMGRNLKDKSQQQDLLNFAMQFESRINEEAKTRNKKKLSTEERVQILNDLTKEVVLNKRSFWTDKSVRAFELNKARAADIDVDDIPESVATQIKSHPTYKKSPGPERLKEMYLHYLKKQGK